MLGEGLPTRISSTSVQSRGDAGKIFIDVADTVTMTIGGQITSSSLGGSGNAGEVTVTAQNLFIDAEGQISLDAYYEFFEDEFGEDLPDEFEELPEADDDLFALSALLDIQSGDWLKTGLTSRSEFNSTGNAGIITVIADHVSVKNAGEISTSANSFGNAGDIFISASTLDLIQDTDVGVTATISSSVEDRKAGSAGGIHLQISDTFNLWGGLVSVNTAAMAEEQDELRIPGIILIETDNLVMTNHGVISSGSTGNVAAGLIEISAADTIDLDNASITSSAINADAGEISLSSTEFFISDSLITTSVTAEGNGGDIDIRSNFILMDTGFIQGNTGGANFSGGNINIASDFLIASNRSLLTGSDERQQFVPGSGINVIQAAAPDGVSGDVNIGALEFDLSDELASIGGEVLNLDSLQSNPCDTSSGSSLASVGKGGQPATAGGFYVATMTASDIKKRLAIHSSANQADNHDGQYASGIDYRSQCPNDTPPLDSAATHGAP